MVRFDISGPGASMSGETLRRDRRGRGVEGATRVEEGGEERPLVLLHRIGKGRGRCAIVYARVPPYRTHRIHSRIPTTYTRSQLNETCWRDAWYTHRNALVFLLLANPLPDPSLCFFVRAKIINGEGPGSLRPTPECQFLDNDEVCTSGPPLRPVQRSYATRVARLCASFLSSFVCTSLFRRGVLMRLRMFGYVGHNGTDHERCAYIIEYIWLFPRYREKSRIQCSFEVSTVTE